MPDTVTKISSFLPALGPISTKLICLPMSKQITAALLQEEGHMQTQVNRSQFEIEHSVVEIVPPELILYRISVISSSCGRGTIARDCRAERFIGTATFSL